MEEDDKIIDFPKELSELRKIQNSQLKLTSPDVSYSKIITGDWSYTCPNCDEKISFNSENMIFRSIELYCTGCNNLHKVTNPAFSLNCKSTR